MEVWNVAPKKGSVCRVFHVTGMQHSMKAPIFAGSSFVLMTRWDRKLAAELKQRYGCTHWIKISTMVIDFLENAATHP